MDDSQTPFSAPSVPDMQAEKKANTKWLPELRAILSGVLLWSAYPPTGLWWMGWLALIPWFGIWVDHPNLSRRRLLRVSFVGGMSFWIPAIQWVRLSDPSAWVGWLVMSMALAIWWPMMALLVDRIHRRNGWSLLSAWTVVWGFQEIGREYYLSGFPWYHLAHSQYRQVWLIQISDLFGTTTLSLIMVAFQVLVAQWFFGCQFSWRDAPKQWCRGVLVVLVSLVFNLAYGQVRIRTAEFQEGPNVALLQSDVPQSRRLNPDHEELIELYKKMVQQVIASQKNVDLIVWPETSFPYPLIVADPQLDEPATKSVLSEYVHPETVEDWYVNRNEAQLMMNEWVRQSGSPIVVGATAWDLSQSGFRKFNTAALFDSTQPPQYYYKMHLVPFGEYIPWTDIIPFVADLAPFPPDQRPNLKHGENASLLLLKNRWCMAPLICFEDTVPHVVRRFFAVPDKSGNVDLLMNISNDGWFRGSEEHEVHLSASVFRCIETRTPMIRSVNTGISAVIDSNGRIVSEVPVAKEQVLIENVPISLRYSIYRVCGDVSGFVCCSVVAVGLIFRRKIRQV
ncbi:MAG: hypothetical protein RJA81_201 [Planctomycetota bacterium]|jgi:apolipoprotein N-acyltransferase